MSLSVEKVEALLGIRRTKEARALLSEALRDAPQDPSLLALLAHSQLIEGNTDEAVRVLDEALARDPKHARARRLAALAKSEVGRYDEAETLLLALIRENPTDAWALAQYAWLMLRNLHFAKAKALAEAALRHDTDESTARTVLFYVDVVEGRKAEADEGLHQIVRNDPEALQSLSLLYNELVRTHRYREAERLGRALLRANPSDPDVLAALTEVKAAQHWSSLPLWPLHRFGWPAAIGLWVGAMACFLVAISTSGLASAAGLLVIAAYLTYVVYSWIQPPLLRRWLTARGF